MTDYIELPIDIQQMLTPQQAWHYRIIGKSVDGNSISFYIDESSYSSSHMDELELLFDKKILFDKQSSSVIQKTLSKYYRLHERNTTEGIKTIDNFKSEDFLHQLISEAKDLGSSDIHIEVYEEKCRVRIRIDGKLIERFVIDRDVYPSLINKIKIKANLDIAEKRLPQDGRILFNEEGYKFDIRVSALPTLHGEKMVLRLLNNDATNIDITQLGFDPEDLENYLEGIRKPHGIVLISGPTGSGKTTTLYATLKILNKEHTNVVTIEDPIEYTLEGINQVQLKEAIGLTFASALRTFLRQDPDVIMLGEIRDPETAEMAIRAALTGHLVLSTIHTNSAWGTISRLLDMKVPAFLLAGTLNTSVAQRLVRLLCPHCKIESEFEERLLPRNYKPLKEINRHFIPVGCDVCYHTGYKGRKAIYEVIGIDQEMMELIKSQHLSAGDMLKRKGIRSLADNAFELLEKGETSMDEVYPILMNNEL
jgi:type IV pilus assembly protein PilB